MIRPLTLVRLGLTAEAGCPELWTTPRAGLRPVCVVGGATHLCVGDYGHGGKHVCPCGRLLATVGLETRS